MRPRVLCLLGPTAVGKTALCVALAQHLPIEVISADSRQIYRGLAIGAAAPSGHELAAVPHHLIGFLEPSVTYSVAEFVAAAEALAHQIIGRHKVPVVTAGTGLYAKALTTGWTLTGVAADTALRAELEAEAAQHGSGALHQRLAQVDPVAAARLAPADTKRVVRALEVYLVSGQPLSAHHQQAGHRPVPFDYHLVGLSRERASLHQRIERRLTAMLADGWLTEVRGLLDSGLSGAEPAFESLGYRELAAVVRGELDVQAALATIALTTKRFAKRQLTWFRALPVELWLDLERFTVEQAAAQLATWWSGLPA